MENEGPWHKAWKEVFPFEWRENVRCDEATGEKHIADIRRPDDLVIELQNSPMPLDEMQSREDFYGNKMVWVVNAEGFWNHIGLGAALPAPEHPQLEEYRLALPIYGPSSAVSWLGYVRRADLDARTSPSDLVRHFSSRDLGDLTESNRGHYSWFWKRPREAWLHARRTVFLDTGVGNSLWALVDYKGHDGKAIYRVDRRLFIEAALSGGLLDFDRPTGAVVPIANQT